MTTRFLVLSPDAATSAQLGDDLTTALEKRGSVTRIGALEGTTLPDAVATPDNALLKVVNTVRKATTDTVVIDGLADAPVRFFYTLGWNLDLAASTKAGIVLTLDTEGVPTDLLKVEIEEARERAESHEAEIKAVALPASVASSISVPGLVILPLPLTEESIEALVGTPTPTAMTPLAFQADLVDKARNDRKRIVLPEPEDDRVLEAAEEVLQRGIADIILIGNEDEVRARAGKLGFDISGATIVSVDNPDYAEKYAVEFARLREKKGVTLEQARETIKDVSYFGTMMVHMGDADGMVSGARHTTAHTILPSFQIIKTVPGVSLVSSVFLMLMRDRMWAFGDCAVNPNPTPEQLADIAISSAETARQFGIDPKVAMLSYSTGTSGTGSDVDAIVEATRLAREKAPDLPIDGPIQFDAAVDPSVAATKLPDSPVAGNATVFIFPSLNAGNIGYKAVQRSSGAVAVGPVLQGLNKPVNDLSRGALVEDIVNTVALTAVQAQD